MSKLIGLAWLAIVPIEIFMGLSGLFLIEAAVAVILLGGAVTLANTKGLLPGTSPYEQRTSLERAQNSLEIARINRVRTRINMLENQDVDKILALGPGKEVKDE